MAHLWKAGTLSICTAISLIIQTNKKLRLLVCLSMSQAVNKVNRPKWFVSPETATEVSLTSSNPAQYCSYMDHWPLRNLRSFKLDVIIYQVDTPHISLCLKKRKLGFPLIIWLLKSDNLKRRVLITLLFSYYLCTVKKKKNRSYSQWEESSGVKEQLFPWCQPLILEMKLLELTELL